MKKIFSMPALLFLTAVGATAQTTYTVTVKGGTKKVKRVTAAMAAPRPQAEGHALTASALGEIVGSDGRA